MTDDTRQQAWDFSSEGYVSVPGGSVWYGICGQLGSGKTPLLVIHGGPGMSHHYLQPLANLADERPVIFYDQLDAGQSDRPNDPANWRIDRFLREIELVRQALSMDEVVIFGNSWGGTLAAAYAAERPEGLVGVVLSSPLIRTETWIKDNATYRGLLPENVREILDTYEAEKRTDEPAYSEAVDVFYRRHLCRLNPWPDYVEQTFEVINLECYSAMWGPNEFTCTGVLRNYDGSATLSKIASPTFVTCGAFDEAAPESTRSFAALIPNVEFEIFESSSHMAFVEEQTTYLNSLRRFIHAAEEAKNSNSSKIDTENRPHDTN